MSDLGNKEIMGKNIQFYMDLYNKSRNDEYSVLRVPLIRDRIPSVVQSVPLTY